MNPVLSSQLLQQEKGMTVREDCAVREVVQGTVLTQTGEDIEFDECLWCTQAGSPEWLKTTGLPLGIACQHTPALTSNTSSSFDKLCLPEQRKEYSHPSL